VTESAGRGSASRGVFFALASATLMMSQHTAAKALRDAMFLSYFDVTDLPVAMVAAGVVSLIAAIVMSRALTRIGPSRLVPLVFGTSALLLVAERVAFLRYPHETVIALYLHVGIGTLLISSYWSLVNERFDPHTAKRIVTRIAAFSALGGVIGGGLADRVSAYLGLASLLYVLAGLHACCAFATASVGGTSSSAAVMPSRAPVSGSAVMRDSAYLQMMMVLVALIAVIETLVDYGFKAQAEARFASGEALIQFFAIFYTVTGVLGFLLQAGVGARVLRRIGVSGVMMVTPAIVVVFGTFSVLFMRLWSIVLLRGLQVITSNSLFRAGFELLYAPLPREAKRATKPYVDVGGQRIGDILGGAFVLWLLMVVPSLSTALVVAGSIVLAVAAAVVVMQLHGMHVRELGNSLRLGIVSLDDSTTLDLQTATSAAGTIAIDRTELLARIRKAQDEARRAAEAAERAADVPPIESQRLGVLDKRARATLDRIETLSRGDAVAVRGVLMARPEDPRLVPYAALHLAGPAADAASLFLRRAAPRAVGSLTDLLLDTELDSSVRRRVASALGTVSNDRALQGLIHGAAGTAALLGRAPGESSTRDEFYVRLACARAAVAIVERNPHLRVADAQVYALLQQELAAGRSVLEGRARPDGDAADSVLLDPSASVQVPIGVEHVFTLLALAHDRRLIAAALRGLYAGDPNVRGTALEYLETILPETERAALWPILSARVAAQKSARAADEVADELLRTAVVTDFDRGQLRRR